jgi:uncharacterized protein (TIGR03546 family)
MRTILKLIKVMNSETDPLQIGLGLCLGLVAGLTPLASLHNLVVLLLVMLLRVNISSFITATLFFSGVAWAIDPLMSRIGLALLSADALEGLWTALYNITVMRLARFNNSIVMGSLVLSLALFVPVLFASIFLIRQYRENVMSFVNRLKAVQALKASKFYRMYDSLSDWGVK